MITPPEPPPPGPWRSGRPPASSGHASVPLPPFAAAVAPFTVPALADTTMLPPAPPPPPPSLSGVTPTPPLAVMVPVPVSVPVRIITIPPPVPPEDANPLELLRLPAPPPPPSTTRVADAVKAAPPRPPTGRPGGGWVPNQLLPPIPPWPPLAPPPPPEFSVLFTGCASVPPPPALPGAPRAASPSGYPSAPPFTEAAAIAS